MRLDARDVDYIWSSATILRVQRQHNKETNVTIRFDGWGKQYDETLEWNSQRLAPLYSFTKCVKCLVDLLPKQRKIPTEEELESIPDSAPKRYCNLWPCKVQFRMPHPVDNDNDDDVEDCTKALADLKHEDNIFIQPYNIRELPRQVRHELKENDGMWLKAKRCKPWTSNPTELGVLSPKFRETFRLAKMDTATPGVLPPLSLGVLDRGSLLQEKYRVHSRQGSLVRDGALREEEEEYSYHEEVEDGKEEVEKEEEDIVEGKVPAQPTATQQQQPESKMSNCIVM